ncbi:MAG TPA: ribosome maturation factor RimP [Acidimicrobiales bacterium]|nr:ribosome maturation factor RimP [Acidimicrobiales bacterium]
MSSTDNTEQLRALIEPALAAQGLELFDLLIGGGIVRVVIDRDGGVDLETVTSATRELNRVLDESDPVPGRYTLEVSSPGIERALRTPEHFQRAVGEIVKIRTQPDVEGPRRLRGELVQAGPDEVLVAVEGDDAPRRLVYGEIERARTVFDWERATSAKQSSGKGRG